MISSTESEAAATVMAMEKSVKGMNHDLELMERVTEASDQVRQIVLQQRAATDQAVEAIEQVSVGTQQVSDTARRLAEAAAGQAASAQDLQRAAETPREVEPCLWRSSSRSAGSAPRRGPEAAIARRPPPSAASAKPAAYIAEGAAALATGDPRAAAAAFRRACYLDPDDRMAHLHLALALEAAGDGGARRAFAAARARLVSRGPAGVDMELEGFQTGEVMRPIEQRLGPAG